MQKIRIGNDVKLNITLRGTRSYDSSNIKQLRCYLVNTEYENTPECDCNCNCKDSRCGYPVYHVFPEPPHKHHHERPVGLKVVDQIAPDAPEYCKYLAPSKLTSAANGVIVYFPACDQKACGIYNLVVSITTFEPGWGNTDLRTYTIDYGSVIELVSDGTGVSGDIEIDVDTDTMQYSNILSIKVINTPVTLMQEQHLNLNEMDAANKYYRIQVLLENGSTVYYDPNNWPYEALKFTRTSTGANDVTVDANTGALIAPNTASETTIQVSTNRASDNVSTTFTANVAEGSYDYVGFSTVTPIDGPDTLDLTKLTKTQDLTSPVSVHNDTEGSYLWIVTRKPIFVAAEANSNVSGGFAINIPLTDPMFVTGKGLYYYACPNAIKADETGEYSHIYVKYKD